MCLRCDSINSTDTRQPQIDCGFKDTDMETYLKFPLYAAMIAVDNWVGNVGR